MILLPCGFIVLAFLVAWRLPSHIECALAKLRDRNDSSGAGGFGHSAMFVELYDDNGNTSGIAIYEVGSTDKDGNFGLTSIINL